ncbi:hypothetical protein ACLUEY_09945 [Vreelandella aquamarina]
MPHYCQGLNPLPRDAARRLYEQRLAKARQQRLAQNPSLVPRDTPFYWRDVDTTPDWMDNLSAEGWNDMMGEPDLNEEI